MESTAFNSRWMLNKAGLLSFWYYDDQEFFFEDGRLLLRGSNGSGKSVTMQSLIPLLLDGNRSPSRLDPFGSKERKLDNYLLEEDDGNDERTGYLYMEFKRQKSETYQTIGMGMRARRNKPLDTWYFYFDGRVNVDKKLYKKDREVGKVPLNKGELKAAIGSSGQVYDHQKEYMETINRLLFGFETVEEYGEMINLLIQLRSPKLSKDFKPTVIHEILNDSLPSLSEDDLRPMSEAIENMDGQKSDLENIESAKKAADRIMAVFSQYNYMVIREKIGCYQDFIRQCKRAADQLLQQEKCLNEDITALETAENSQEIYERDKKAIEEQRDNLVKDYGDVLNGKKKLSEAEEEEEQQRIRLEEKEREQEAKEKRLRETEAYIKNKEAEGQTLEAEIAELFEVLNEEGDTACFEEQPLFADEFYKDIKKAFDFSYTRQAAKEYRNRLGKILSLLNRKSEQQSRYEEAIEICDVLKLKRDDKISVLDQSEKLLIEAKSELIEKIRNWGDENKNLLISEGDLAKIRDKIRSYSFSDYNFNIKEDLSENYHEIINEINHLLVQAENRRNKTNAEKTEREEKARILRNTVEVEPERTPGVIENRKRLAKMRIPYKPFYRLLKFKDSTSETDGGNIEEALLEMGVLDALVIPKEYREKVLNADKGMCDKYIFSDGGSIENISQALEEEWEQFPAELTKPLQSILRGGFAGSTGINEGGYQIGVLTGRISGEYTSRFIGEKARERNRLRQISELEEEIAGLEVLLREQEKEIAELSERKAGVNREYQNMPDIADLLEAGNLVKTGIDELERAKENLNRQEKQRQEIVNKINEIREEVFSASQGIDINPEVSEYEEAIESMDNYRNTLAEVSITHGRYLESINLIDISKEQYEDYLQDIDIILRDKGLIEGRIKDLLLTCEKLREQLALDGYEQVKEKIDYCNQRLKELPDEIRQVFGAIQVLNINIARRKEEIERDRKILKVEEEKTELIKNAVIEEGELGYTEIIPAVENHTELMKQYQRLGEIIAGYPVKDMSSISTEVMTRFITNNAYLIEYGPNMAERFENNPLLPVQLKRVDITCKKQGKNISFHHLIEEMGKEIEAKRLLLKESDRQLFEEILANNIGVKIKNRIYKCEDWVKEMNRQMGGMNTSSGLSLSLAWKSRRGDTEEQMNSSELVDLLKKDAELRTERDFERITSHFHSKIDEARKRLEEKENVRTLHAIIRDVLDYRKWFDFHLFYTKTGERQRELTNKAFFQFSGGEKAMSMYVPLFSAVVAKYSGARSDAPRLVSLDEAFAGVDDKNIKDMFKLMYEFNFNFIINSQVLWGDYETIPKLSIYQLHRPNNAKFVGVIRFRWDGHMRSVVPEEEANDG